jgi:hypothetical protein
VRGGKRFHLLATQTVRIVSKQEGPYLTPNNPLAASRGSGIAMTTIALSTLATNMIIAQRLGEAVWQPFGREATLPEVDAG